MQPLNAQPGIPMGVWIALVGVSITVLVQFAGVIWFAATQRAMLNAMQSMVRELRIAVDSLKDIASALDKRVTILEDRAGSRRRRATDP